MYFYPNILTRSYPAHKNPLDESVLSISVATSQTSRYELFHSLVLFLNHKTTLNNIYLFNYSQCHKKQVLTRVLPPVLFDIYLISLSFYADNSNFVEKVNVPKSFWWKYLYRILYSCSFLYSKIRHDISNITQITDPFVHNYVVWLPRNNISFIGTVAEISCRSPPSPLSTITGDSFKFIVGVFGKPMIIFEFLVTILLYSFGTKSMNFLNFN